jgi:hypothetical protein
MKEAVKRCLEIFKALTLKILLWFSAWHQFNVFGLGAG